MTRQQHLQRVLRDAARGIVFEMARPRLDRLVSVLETRQRRAQRWARRARLDGEAVSPLDFYAHLQRRNA